MKFLYSCILLLASLFFTVDAYARQFNENPIAPIIEENSDTHSARPVVITNNHSRQDSSDKHSNQQVRPHSPPLHYVPPSMPPHPQPHKPAHVYFPQRVTYHYRPVVFYEDAEPIKTIKEDSSTITVDSSVKHISGVLGFGIRGVVSINSQIYDVRLGTSGGVGFYFKFRPIRYFSIEFINDYLFGSLDYSYYSQSFVKIPFVIGGRFHFLDYGHTDIYAAVAFSASAWSYISDSEYWHHNYYTYTYNVGIQYGGQIGLGVNYIANVLEVGIDLRYTLESVPDFIPRYYEYSGKSDNIVHGALLSFNIGFIL